MIEREMIEKGHSTLSKFATEWHFRCISSLLKGHSVTKMTTKPFDVETFFSLGELELGEYVEPYLVDAAATIPEPAYGILLGELYELDIGHKVYALELCMRINPDDFKRRLVTHLSNENSAVCCAAYNLLNKLGTDDINDELSSQLASVKEVSLVTNDVRTGVEIRIGSNRQFIEDLRRKFLESDTSAPPSA